MPLKIPTPFTELSPLSLAQKQLILLDIHLPSLLHKTRQLSSHLEAVKQELLVKQGCSPHAREMLERQMPHLLKEADRLANSLVMQLLRCSQTMQASNRSSSKPGSPA